MSDARSAPTPARPGEFERYGLMAAVTLVVLCLLLADRMRPSVRRTALPPSDRLVRLELGGDRPVAARDARRESTTSRRDSVEVVPPPARRPPPEPPPPEAPRVHVVRTGETLAGIAREALGSTRRASEIAALNGLDDPDRIRAGQSLRLPPR